MKEMAKPRIALAPNEIDDEADFKPRSGDLTLPITSYCSQISIVHNCTIVTNANFCHL